MKVKYLIKSLLFISVLLCLAACKKYKKTVIKGRLVNIPIERGIPNETVVLKSYAQGGFLLPDDAPRSRKRPRLWLSDMLKQ